MGKWAKTVVALVSFVSGIAFAQGAPPPPVAANLDTGNALVETIAPSIVPVLLDPVTGVKPGDATIVLRVTTLIGHACFDAIAPYHPTAVGVSSRLGRRPASESVTNRNKNIAMSYASYRVLLSLYPKRVANWRAMMNLLSLNPDDNSLNPTTAVGIGNLAGNAVVADREHDGMNQLGDEGGREYNRFPYADTTGYEPRNSPYELRDASRWQPEIVSNGNGIFSAQQFVTPQMAVTRAYSFRNVNQFQSPAPVDSQLRGPQGRQRYKAQADVVIAATANLNDETKMIAEFFNNKVGSLGYATLFVALSRGMTIDQVVQYDFLVNAAAFDGAIATWNQKVQWDAVRPHTAIRYVYGNQRINAWGGPGLGTVSMRGNEFRPYFGVADHPDYPSGSACFCAAHAQSSRRFLGTGEALGLPVQFPAGSSGIEPGVTPAADLTVVFPTWNDFETRCAQSRVNAGVHFQAAVNEGRRLCKPIGDRAYEFLQAHVNGTAPAPQPPRCN